LPKTVLFVRNFSSFRGGHLKIVECLEHARSSPAYEARLYVTPESREDHPWRDHPCLVETLDLEAADVLVLGGSAWRFVPDDIEETIPVVNLVQGMRHADSGHRKHDYLKRRALRLCVSDEVRAEIEATGLINGLVRTMATALDASAFPTPAAPNGKVFIAGQKARQIAADVAERLRAVGVEVDCAIERCPREEFLARMAAAEIAVVLPLRREGFFLPALEAMLLQRAVVCPDCVGNRGFCFDGETCVVPDYNAEAVAAAVLRLRGDAKLRDTVREGGHRAALARSVEQERLDFLSALNSLGPRNVIITGLPRSGTTLSCHLLNKLQNVVALHEPMPIRRLKGLDEVRFVEDTVAFFERQRRMIREEGVASSKTQDGKVPMNPLADKDAEGVRQRQLNGKTLEIANVTSDDFDLCIKHPTLFTARLHQLRPHFDCYALVRNPLSVLLSWRDSGMPIASGKSGAIETLHPALADRLAAMTDVVDRQIALIDFFFSQYRDHTPGNVIKYEDVIATGGRELARIAAAAATLDEPLSSRNRRAIGEDPEAIRIAETLLKSDNACWDFYRREDVEQLLA
jgi:glycosyltransferase involved in cell wall biosynthesis